MKNLNRSDILKIRILNQFKKKDIYYTASYIASLLDSKYETVHKALEFFFQIDILEKDIKEHAEKNVIYYLLTEFGRNLLKSQKI